MQADGGQLSGKLLVAIAQPRVIAQPRRFWQLLRSAVYSTVHGNTTYTTLQFPLLCRLESHVSAIS